MTDFYTQDGFGEINARPDQQWTPDPRDSTLRASLEAAALAAQAGSQSNEPGALELCEIWARKVLRATEQNSALAFEHVRTLVAFGQLELHRKVLAAKLVPQPEDPYIPPADTHGEALARLVRRGAKPEPGGTR